MSSEKLGARFQKSQLDAVDEEIARLSYLCDIRLLEPGIIERVIAGDESVCGKANPIAFKKLHNLVKVHYMLTEQTLQSLYLYIMGQLKDTFKVSTGKGKKYETPEMSRHPEGPVLTKYTSKKFPGGNYMGLGNMPYAVFISNGYAIHGTTPGNFAKLGNRASHGCIRLHPDNAKVFNALVKTVGLKQTWVSVKDSLP